MSEETQTDTNTEVDTSAADDVASMVTENNFDFVLEKYQAEGRTPEEAAFEQAKAYGELQGRFGSFTGAPDEYQVNLDESYAEHDIQMDSEHPLYDDIVEFAKDSNMNQEGFDKIVDLFAMSELAEQQAHQEIMQEELALLGDNGQSRLDNISKWAQVNLKPDMLESFNALATSAESVKALESLISMTRAAPMDAQAPAAPAADMNKLKEMQFALDDNGNRKMATDPNYRKMVEEMYNRSVPGGNSQMVG